MKHLCAILVLLLALLQSGLHAQQVQQFTQYRFAGLSYNPAFAGSDTYFNGFALHRSQWVGINDAPRTYIMGLHAPAASGKMGLGGTLYTDVTGPTRRAGINGTYAYHFQVSDASKVSLGVAAGITQYSLDGTQITVREQGDMAMQNAMRSEIKPDASFGVLWYSDKFYLGLSANQLINNKLQYFPGDTEGRMAVHYFATGAYRIGVSEDFDVEPIVLAKYVNPLNVQTDFSARVIYRNNIWLGGTFRTNDAAAIFAGYQILDYLCIGYSMDFATTDIRNYSDGTHEILISVRFSKKQMIVDDP